MQRIRAAARAAGVVVVVVVVEESRSISSSRCARVCEHRKEPWCVFVFARVKMQNERPFVSGQHTTRRFILFQGKRVSNCLFERAWSLKACAWANSLFWSI